MVATSLKQLIAIATNTANKMDAQGYTAEYVDPDTYAVSYLNGEGQPVEYRVNVTEPAYCSCQYFKENYPVFGQETTCKHLIYARRQRDQDEWADEWEALRETPTDYDPFGDHHHTA